MDNYFMNKALELAKKGEGFVNPNPLVGAVIVKNGEIIAEGYHRCFGMDHAERDAFKNAKEDVAGATMYVTLEPCCHYGKTPPCTEAIIEKGISKVVIAMKDPNPLVAGKGVEQLRKNNIEVVTGVMEKEARELNEIFIKYIKDKTPFVLIKSAMTLDGKIATSNGDSKWISCEKSRELVHRLRNKYASILVGVNTVIADDPQLNVRLPEGGKDPVIVVLDTDLRIPLNSKMLQNGGNVIIAAGKNPPLEKKTKLESLGCTIITAANEGKPSISEVLKELGKRGIDSVLIEGGGEINYSAISEGVVDKVMMFIAPKIIGGREGKSPYQGQGVQYMRDAIKLRYEKIYRINEDLVVEAYIKEE